MSQSSGRQFLQLPGPTNLPDRILRAMDRPLIDHRGPDFASMMHGLHEGLGGVFGASAGVMIFPSSATGCWESALVNTLSPGDTVLLCDNGFFARKWGALAERLGFDVRMLDADWRRPIDAASIAERLAEDTSRRIRAALIVHNETSTGVTSDVSAVRAAIDDTGHDALFMVDSVSSLGATEYRHDEWGVDVTVCGSQKGLMLPPGLGFCAVSEKALAAAESARSPRAYWDWSAMREANASGSFPFTPATGLLFGLVESLAMLDQEGDAVFRRHARFAEATRRAAGAWGLENYCVDPAGYSNSGTTLMMPGQSGADAFRATCLGRFDLVLGGGLGPLRDQVFRIGHLGDFNSLMLAGTLSGVEMGLRATGAEVSAGGVQAALDYLLDTSGDPAP
ncbi:MAG: alanine--glyoxylate aminotransferase family protein [Gemmatimonadota bacterium]